MLKTLVPIACLLLPLGGTAGSGDPHQWLETVDSERVNAWVDDQNAATFEAFTDTPRFRRLNEQLLDLYNDEDRIPVTTAVGGARYNFWTDAQSTRGIWRRTSAQEYAKADPDWEVLIDVDALAAAEDENWVFKGATILRPENDRALIRLSRGGADATVVREYDLSKKSFVENGFVLPEAKTWVAWIDRDTLAVATDTGPGSLSESGYPIRLKRWQRGTPLKEAETYFEAKASDIGVFVDIDRSAGYHQVINTLSFFEREYWLLNDGKLERVDVPLDAIVTLEHDLIFVEPKKPWQLGKRTFAPGTLLVATLEAFRENPAALEPIFSPQPDRSLNQFVATKRFLVLNEQINVVDRLRVLKRDAQGWSEVMVRIVEPGELSSITIAAIAPELNDQLSVRTSGFLQPLTLTEIDLGSGKSLLTKANPHRFPTRGLTVAQHWATSKDGTRVPYFQIGPANAKNRPTVMQGYGGFEVSLKPGYSVTRGHAWLQHGNVHVTANIRGGGEFGPDWHRAALKENRNKAYEDFIAVAEDLIARGVTTPKRLGITGGSNGGLLVGNMLTMRPDLFGGIISHVPLLDMRRYNKLLAGASWQGEYGDPDDPDVWSYLKAFSPYHNVDPDVNYPPVLFASSKRDDRVHPAHARKMVALMQESGSGIYYYENTEGGHAGAADNKQAAFRNALSYEFFRATLD